MEYRNLGKAGIKLSALSLGAWVTYGGQVNEEVAYNCMTTAYEAGVNFFDNAEAYANGNAEVVMGNVIKRTGWNRNDLIVSTKLFWGGDGPNNSGLSFKHISEGINASLKRLQMDYVDLIFCHRPDTETPIEETVWAMNQVIRQGKAFYWGTSEWSATEIMEAYGVARREHLVPPTMEQPQYHMFHRQKVESEFLRLYREMGLGTTIWSPLASGLLTGKYHQGIPKGSRLDLEGFGWLKERLDDKAWKENLKKLNDLDKIAKDLGGTLAQLALAWCLKNPNVSTVITGASKAEQVRENMRALEIYQQMGDDVMASIDEILENKPEGEPNYR
jgi:voltage-dependent potassium channel beta subunit